MTFGHSGDLGDIIFALPIIQQLGGKHDLRLYDRPWTKELEIRFDLIQPLLSQQPYIREVLKGDGPVDYDLSTFRQVYQGTQTLLASQGQWLKKHHGLAVPTGENPWITVDPNPETRDHVVIARSARYHNEHFPWKRIVEHYGDRLLFIGLPEEHQDFCRLFGHVRRFPTADLLQVAQAIKGSALFIGNQSSPNAVAEGLKHPRIQETCHWVPDCIYPGTGAQYVADGGVYLPPVSDVPELILPSVFSGYRRVNESEAPPGCWQYPGETPQFSFRVLSEIVARKLGISVDAAKEKVYTHNCERLPQYFRNTDGDGFLAKVHTAKRNAGL